MKLPDEITMAKILTDKMIWRNANDDYVEQAFHAGFCAFRDSEIMKELVEAVTLNVDWDCGDNSCQFAKQKGGMRTNGGCRCLENFGGVHKASTKHYINRLRFILERYKKWIGNL